jgi:hypothetical protein
MLKKTQAGAEVEFTITVKEFATPKDGAVDTAGEITTGTPGA